MDQELERYHKSNAQLDLNISDLKLKQEGLKREVLAQRAALERSHTSIKEFHHDIHDVVQSLQVRANPLPQRCRKSSYLPISLTLCTCRVFCTVSHHLSCRPCHQVDRVRNTASAFQLSLR